MKNLPIKWKIMLWYTALLALLLAIILPLMYLFMSDNLYRDAETLLQSEVGRVVESLEAEKNTIKLDSDFELVSSGVSVAVFSPANELTSGKLPSDINLPVEPNEAGVYRLEIHDNRYLVLDYKLMQNGKDLGWLRAVKQLDAVDRTLDILKLFILIVIPCYLGIALVGGFFVAKRSLVPISDITKTAKQIGQNDLKRRLRMTGPKDEIGLLADTFDDMLDRLEYSFEREKRFSSDVSHELRTPVTAIMVSAEEALSGNKAELEYKQTLATILKESKIMNTMISQLLMMARSDSGKYQFDMESIDVSALTAAIIEQYSESLDNKDVNISYEIEKDIVLVVEQTLYMRLLINLIDNAMKYTKPGGFVKVFLKKSKNQVILSVEDNGIGISAENLPKIWDRFFKAEPSRIDASPGLGLSMVKWIADIHGAKVSVKSELNKGSIFEVHFNQED